MVELAKENLASAIKEEIVQYSNELVGAKIATAVDSIGIIWFFPCFVALPCFLALVFHSIVFVFLPRPSYSSKYRISSKESDFEE